MNHLIWVIQYDGLTFKWFSNKSSVIIDFKSSKSELIESVSMDPSDGDDAKWDILWNKILSIFSFTSEIKIGNKKIGNNN